VTQKDERIVELYIEDTEGNPLDEIIFYDYYGNNTPYEAKPLRIRWAPHGTNAQGVNFNCDVRIGQVGDDVFTFKAGTEQIQSGKLTDANGVKEYTVEPEKFTAEQVSELLANPFRQHASWITFTVTDPDNSTNTVSKTIYLNYQHLAIISRNFRRLSYLNRNYTFDVLSNTRWVVESIANNDGIFTSSSQVGSYGGNDIVNGQPLTYTMVNANLNSTYMNGMGQAGRKATFYLRDQRGIIPDLIPFTVSAVYEDPNCYIVNPPASGSTTLRIPIRKLFWIREREADDPTVTDITSGQWAYRPVWEEYYDASMNPINGYSISIDRVAAGSHVLEDMLQITIPARSGGVNGNILVGVHRPGENTYLWSWHIRLTDYNPDATNGAMEVDNAWFMRRNIGALSGAELLNDRTTGFYYQWGRKDPLRPADITGNRVMVSETKNLKNTIDNPRIFYYSDIYPSYDWYTKETLKPYQDDFLWNEYDDHKSQYDPCPAGWRVPNLLRNQSSGNSLWRETTTNFNVIIGNAVQGFHRIWRDHTTGDHIFTPANGLYNHTGNLENYGEFSFNYNANPSQEELREFDSSHVGQAVAGGFDEQAIHRANVVPVRCIKRK
ncbi:MAG: hypothetical protein LUH04_02940, partial [Clostridium sp.]|nr:hypothetical protein [Clostridium sp.]